MGSDLTSRGNHLRPGVTPDQRPMTGNPPRAQDGLRVIDGKGICKAVFYEYTVSGDGVFFFPHFLKYILVIFFT